jgi:hypothetical protein
MTEPYHDQEQGWSDQIHTDRSLPFSRPRAIFRIFLLSPGCFFHTDILLREPIAHPRNSSVQCEQIGPEPAIPHWQFCQLHKMHTEGGRCISRMDAREALYNHNKHITRHIYIHSLTLHHELSQYISLSPFIENSDFIERIAPDTFANPIGMPSFSGDASKTKLSHRNILLFSHSPQAGLVLQM